MLTRWACRYRSDLLSTIRIWSIQHNNQQRISVISDMGWTKSSTLKESQDQSADRSADISKDSDVLFRLDGMIWIPDGDLEMQRKLIMISNCGSMVHSGSKSAQSALMESFIWSNIKAYKHSFFNKLCSLNCHVNRRSCYTTTFNLSTWNKAEWSTKRELPVYG